MMMYSPTMDNTGLEDFVTNQIFTQEGVNRILKILVQKYIILTP